MSCGKLPVIGYTEFNEITYNYLKKHFNLCHKSGRQYYNWQELTDQKQIYELW